MGIYATFQIQFFKQGPPQSQNTFLPMITLLPEPDARGRRYTYDHYRSVFIYNTI